MMPVTNNTLPLTGTGVLYNNQGDVSVVTDQYDLHKQVKAQMAQVIDFEFLEFLYEFAKTDPQLSAAYITFKVRKRMGVK
jgi:hypothetical protein